MTGKTLLWCCPSGFSWNYHPGTLYLSQITVTGLKISSMGTKLVKWDEVNLLDPGGHHKNSDELSTHWGQATHICVSKLSIIGADNGLSPDRRQAIIWTNAGLLLIEPLGTNVSEISSAIHTFSFKKIRLKMLSAKWRPFYLSLNELTHLHLDKMTTVSQTIF